MGLKQSIGLALIRAGLKAAQLPREVGKLIVPPWLDKQPVWTNWSAERAVKEGYKANVWVYVCVRKLAQSASSVPWLAYRRRRDNTLERVPNHPIEQLLQRPNPWHSGQDLIELMTAHLNLVGVGYCHILMARGKPYYLIPFEPQYVSPVPSATNYLDGYEINTGLEKVILKPEQVLAFRFFDPGNPWLGVAPLQPAARTVDTDNEQVNWNKVTMQNRAVADGAFVVEENLTKEQYDELKQLIIERHQGAKNARIPWLLHSGAKWVQMAMTMVEADWLESRKLNREEICAAFGVPPVLVGILDKATYSNYEQAERTFWTDTMVPFLNDLASAINLQLAPLYGDDIVVQPDLTGVPAMQTILRERIDTAQKLFGMGVPWNEINERLQLGFRPLEHGDVGYLPLSLMPAGGTRPSEQQPQAAEAPGDGSKAGGPSGAKAFVRLDSEEAKAAYWRIRDRDRQRWENAIARKIAEQFRAEAKAVVSAYEQTGDVEEAVIAQRDAWRRLLAASYIAVIEHFGGKIAEEAAEKAAKPGERKWEFDPFHPAILDWVSKWAARKVVGIEETTMMALRRALAEGLDNGEGTAQIAKRLREAYDEMERYRSFVIARTETGMAAGYGARESAKQTGLPLRKTWVSSRDDRVRDSHAEIDGETRMMDEPYSNGLMYPGDPDGEAGEVIQCRCVEVYSLAE